LFKICNAEAAGGNPVLIVLCTPSELLAVLFSEWLILPKPADVLKAEQKNTLSSSLNTKGLNKGGNEVIEPRGTVAVSKKVNKVLHRTSKVPLIARENRIVIHKESAKKKKIT
jgi:hypothetical protein